MTHDSSRNLGWLLTVGGIVITVTSKYIVFPGLEMLLGIEVIVGRESVSYNPDGSYVFTNPGAMMAWIAGVAAVGVLLAACGIAVLVHTRTNRMPTNPCT